MSYGTSLYWSEQNKWQKQIVLVKNILHMFQIRLKKENQTKV